MYCVIVEFAGEVIVYGTYKTENRAGEVALAVGEQFTRRGEANYEACVRPIVKTGVEAMIDKRLGRN